jgi:hypothetical protein
MPNRAPGVDGPTTAGGASVAGSSIAPKETPAGYRSTPNSWPCYEPTSRSLAPARIGVVFIGPRGGLMTDRAYLKVFHEARDKAFTP